MSRKKRKPSSKQKQNLAVAQYKNEFFRKFRSVFNIFCDEKLFQQIPPDELENIYNFRSRYIRMVPTKEKYVTKALLEKIKSDLTMLHKRNYITLVGTEAEISIYDFLTVGLSLKLFSSLLKDNSFPGTKEIKESLEKFDITDKFDFEFHNKLVSLFDMVTNWYNDIAKCLYWFNYEKEVQNKNQIGYYHMLSVHSYLPETTSITINGSSRPAILFKWAHTQIGPKCITIKPSSLNIDGPFSDIPLKVYIQKHALQRFAERIDCINTGFAHFFMYLSFKELNVFYDTHNNLLIEYRFADKKAGYFRVDIVDGIILVRTFLFITNNDTPEGQLLEKNTGLQKLDKKYLAMDKLSTFMTSDIGENTELRKILDNSGCHCLIELYELMEGVFLGEGKCITDNLLLSYLNKGNLGEGKEE